ncbi:MAG: glycosyltransferase family 2 protein [Thermoplasmata archaeon]
MSCDVSVIIPTYNSSSTLRRALDSVFGQSVLPREIIIVDDGSDDWDASRLIAGSYHDIVPIIFIRLEENKGPSTARNFGLSIARSRYIAFLDADDIWFKNKLMIQYNFMNLHNIDFSMHSYIINSNHLISDVKSECNINSINSSSLSVWDLIFRDNDHATPSVMVAKEKMVIFDTSLWRSEDWKCWMEVLSMPDCRGGYIRHALAGGFKPGIGHSGLTQDVTAMHASRMSAFIGLIHERKISCIQFIIGICIETIKYPFRILRITLNKYVKTL